MNIHFIRTVILFVTTWICYPIYAQKGDTLLIQRGKSGKIEFARFTINENSDRKMQIKDSNNTIKKSSWKTLSICCMENCNFAIHS